MGGQGAGGGFRGMRIQMYICHAVLMLVARWVSHVMRSSAEGAWRWGGGLLASLPVSRHVFATETCGLVCDSM